MYILWYCIVSYVYVCDTEKLEVIVILCYNNNIVSHSIYIYCIVSISAPSAPGNVYLTNVTTNSITVEWSQPVYPNGGVDLFVIVLIDNNSRAEVDNATILANASNQTVTFSQLLPAWLYTISVAAYTNTLGNSSTVTVLTQGGKQLSSQAIIQSILLISTPYDHCILSYSGY